MGSEQSGPVFVQHGRCTPRARFGRFVGSCYVLPTRQTGWRPMKAPKQAMIVNATRIHVDKLSDKQLLTAIIDTNDPTSLDGIQTLPPLDGCDLWFEMNYEADTSAKCVFGHSHKK